MSERSMAAIVLAGAAAIGGLGFAAGSQEKKAAAEPVPSGSYEVDAVHSSALFKIKHMEVANFYGRFNKMSGTVELDSADPSKSTIKLAIDAASVDTNNDKRDEHLKSPDFFNVAEFPQITFESDSVTSKGGGKFEVVGAFKMHGVEETITVPVEQTGSDPGGRMGTRVGFEARFTIQRSAYDMNYQLGAIGDDVTIVLSVEAVKK